MAAPIYPGRLEKQETILVSSDGTVLYIPDVILKSSCAIDITRDDQTCHMKVKEHLLVARVHGQQKWGKCRKTVMFSLEEQLAELLKFVFSSQKNIFLPLQKEKVKCSKYNKISRKMYKFNVFVFQFGSWTYDGFKMDLDFYDGLEEIDVSDYIANGDWGLLGHPARKNVK